MIRVSHRSGQPTRERGTGALAYPAASHQAKHLDDRLDLGHWNAVGVQLRRDLRLDQSSKRKSSVMPSPLGLANVCAEQPNLGPVREVASAGRG